MTAPEQPPRDDVGELPDGVEREVALAPLTTVRTGGAARFFARPESAAALVELLAWARERQVPIAVIGSGSNLLVADAGFEGLALKLAGSLTGIERDGERVTCGGGMRLPSAAAKTAGWGLAGLEFGVNIPGTVGGSVRMNANAYGGQLSRALEWVEICTPDGPVRRRPEQLGFTYRDSALAADEVVSMAGFTLVPEDPEAVRARLAAMREQRREAQPSGIKTFGSTFKNPNQTATPAVDAAVAAAEAAAAAGEAAARTAGQLLDAAGCRGLTVGEARFSEKHANFVENMGEATTADVLAVMAAGRGRVQEMFGIELEPEVQTVGPVEWPPEWYAAGAGGR